MLNIKIVVVNYNSIKNMDLTRTLKDIGFESAEAKIYLAALELGGAPASEIAKRAHIKRPSAYVLLKSLMKKGCVASYSRRKITQFVAVDPKIIVELALDKVKKAQTVLPELEALAVSLDKGNKPRVEYYEGYDGLVNIMEDTLKTPSTTICGWNDTSLAVKTLNGYYPGYIKKRVQKNIHVNAILTDEPVGQSFKGKSVEEKRTVKLVDRQKMTISNEINIYGDNVFIVSHKDMLGVIIRSKEIADSQRAIFNLCWNLLPNS